MHTALRATGAGLALALLLCTAPSDAAAQGRGNRDREAPVGSATVSLSVDLQSQIRRFYTERPESGAEALPPGIRRNLARGKPLPPGIAKRTAPAELRSRISVPDGYELVEVGLDVLLVEVATSVIHDVLMDIVR